MYKVLLTDNIAKAAVDVFDGTPEIEAVAEGTLDPAELARVLPEYDAVIVRSPTKLTKDLVAAGTKLKFIGRAGVGVDNIDVAEATARGVTVMNAPTGNIVSTAEHTITLIMSVARRISQADRSVRAGKWERSGLKGVELSGKTLGVIGLGRVGREVARRMLAFDMEVIAVDPYVTAEAAVEIGVTKVEMGKLLRDSHFITVHVPLGADTKGIIGDKEIEQMRDGVFLINCARGGVINEAALKKALDCGKVAGAAVDVYFNEPPGEHPLFAHERSIFTPHLGAATRDAQVRVAVDVAQSVAKALLTGTIRHAVNQPGG
jgi:D-3-phosphoglycerate dehydrogenase